MTQQQQQQHHTSSHIIRPSSIAPTRVFISPIPTINTTVVLENDIKKRFCCQHYYASTIVSEQEEVEEQEEEDEEDEEDDSTTMTTTTGGFSTHTESTMTTSPPISPPLSPSTSSRVSRLPRWIRQIGSMSNIKTPTNMPPWYEQEKEQKRLIDTCFRAAALYYEAPEVRQYLHKVTKRDRFDQMLLDGFPVMGNDGATDTGGVAGGARTMTLRLTLTPAHCRATDKEIYGKLSLSLPSSSSHSSTTTPPSCPQTYSLPPPLPATIVSHHHHHRHPPSLPPFVAGAPNNRMAFSPAPDKLPNKINNITSLPAPPPLLVSTMTSPPHLSPTRRSSSLPSSHQRRRILYEQQQQWKHQSPPILVLPPRKK